MKRIIFNSFISAALVGLLPLPISCFKKQDCEQWEVRVEDHYLGGCGIVYLGCNSDRTYSSNICGDALKDANPGNTVTLSESQCCKTTRTFIRKL